MSELNHIKNKKIHYSEIMNVYHIDNYDALRYKISELIEQGKILPIKKSGMTSFRPSVYQEYKTLQVKEDYSYLHNEILTLHPQLALGKYLDNPKSYHEFQKEILAFSNYLWSRKEELESEMSVKERSYAIWGDEKFLEGKAGRQICSYNGFSYKRLNCFYAPESFFNIDLHHDTDNLTVLMLENKDTWYSIGRLLRTSKENELFHGNLLNLLIYGEGNKATRKHAIDEFMQDFTDKSYQIYYTGDIDVAGIEMLYQCMEANPKSDIKPYLPLYQAMLKKADVNNLLQSEDNRGLIYRREFLTNFLKSEQELLKIILDQNKRIPQEILNFQDYKGMLNIMI
jgi:hypothetical protein